MARYIDENKIKFTGFTFENADKEVYVSLSAVRQAIVQTPTADVVEVKHGKWIEQEDMFCSVYYTCSNCRNDWTTIDGTPQENFMNYCPHCGAKMDGGKAE